MAQEVDRVIYQSPAPYCTHVEDIGPLGAPQPPELLTTPSKPEQIEGIASSGHGAWLSCHM